jgi:hypothetical protein
MTEVVPGEVIADRRQLNRRGAEVLLDATLPTGFEIVQQLSAPERRLGVDC